MIMESTLIVKRQLINIIQRFKFEELEDAVIPIFPEISWTDIKSQLVKNHKNFTSYAAARVIEETLKNVKLKHTEICDRLATLEVIDISRHYKRRVWYGYELTGFNGADSYLNSRKIQDSLQDDFHANGFNMDVKVATYKDIMFISTKMKTKMKRRVLPIFFALFLGQKYFFCARKIVSKDFIKIMTTCLKANHSKKIKLMGRDLRSLLRLLQMKKRSALNAENVKQAPVYKSSSPIVKNDGIDFKQNKQRRNYAEQCYGKDPPTLEVLVLKGPEESVLYNDPTLTLPDENISMNWEFRSPNIARFLTNLIDKRVVPMPLPDYISNLMLMAKNELTLQTGEHT